MKGKKEKAGEFHLTIIGIGIRVFLFLFIFGILFRRWVWEELINKHGEEKLNKIILKTGLYVIFAGILVLAGSYLTNSIHENDIIMVLLIFTGIFLIFYVGSNKLVRFLKEEGWIEGR